MRNDQPPMANTYRAAFWMLTVALAALLAFVVYVSINGFDAQAQASLRNSEGITEYDTNAATSSGTHGYMKTREESPAPPILSPTTSGTIDNDTNARTRIVPVPDTGGTTDTDGTSTSIGTSPSAPRLPQQ